MAKKKERQPSNKPTSFRFKPEVIDVLNEIVKTDFYCLRCGKKFKKLPSKAKVIEDALGGLVHFLLRGRISEQQIKSNEKNPHQLFSLFIMYCRAEQGEKGYGFKGRAKKKRTVYGPEKSGGVYAHMVEGKK